MKEPTTVIKRCTCLSPYQDKKYGNGKRVFNTREGNKYMAKAYRCTVCGTIK